MSIQSFLAYLSKIDFTVEQLEEELNNTYVRADAHNQVKNELNEFVTTAALSTNFGQQREFERKIIEILIDYLKAKTSEESPHQVVNDKHEGYFKSELVPEQTEDVKIIVGYNFKEIVNDCTKDVLIVFYSPYDALYMSFAAEYDKLAMELKNESDIVIAKMDISKNSVPEPYEVQGYPTIYFAQKNKKNNPRKYVGARILEDLIDFVAKEATEDLQNYYRDGLKKDDEYATDDEL